MLGLRKVDTWMEKVVEFPTTVPVDLKATLFFLTGIAGAATTYALRERLAD